MEVSSQPRLRQCPTGGSAVAGLAGGPEDDRRPLQPRWAAGACWAAASSAPGRIRRRCEVQRPRSAVRCQCRAPRRLESGTDASRALSKAHFRIRFPSLAQRAEEAAGLKASSPAGPAPASATAHPPEAWSQEPAPGPGHGLQPTQAWRPDQKLARVSSAQGLQPAQAWRHGQKPEVPWGQSQKPATAPPWGQSQELEVAWGLTREGAATA